MQHISPPAAPIGSASSSPDAAGEHTRFWRALGPARPLWQELSSLTRGALPTVSQLEAFAHTRGTTNAAGLALRPVPQPRTRRHYEVAVLLEGVLAIRPRSWHDIFNLLAWWTWPRAKAALNLRNVLHYLVVLEQQQGRDVAPGPPVARDVWLQTLAMLDEGGCVVTNRGLHELGEQDGERVWRWRHPLDELELEACVRWFGHAVLEQLHAEAQGCGPIPLEPDACLVPVSGEKPSPVLPLRLWMTSIASLEEAGRADSLLAERVLRFDLELEPVILPQLERLKTRVQPLRWFLERVCFGEGDPFRKPGASIFDPWQVPARSLRE